MTASLAGSERGRRHPCHCACSISARVQTASPAVPTLEGSRSPYAGARRPITCEMVGRAARFSRLRRTLLGQRGHIGDFLKLIEDIPMVLGEVTHHLGVAEQ